MAVYQVKKYKIINGVKTDKSISEWNKETRDGKMTWYFSTYYVDLDGVNKKKKSKKYYLKKEAEEAERIFLMNYKEQSNNNMTFKNLILDYKNYQKDKVKITSFRNYKKYDDKIEELNNIKLKDFNIKHFNIWKEKISKNNYSTTYKNNIYKYLRALLNYAIKFYNFNDLNTTLNKMIGFNNPNELKKEMEFYSYKEFKEFIKNEKELNYRCFFELLYYCGLRKGEANALTWNDIDFTKRKLIINKSVSLKIKGHKYVLLPPKTKSSIRTIPLPKVLLNSLKTLNNEMRSYKNFSENWFVFGGINPLADTTIQNKNINNSRCLNKTIRIHDFRHSCASLLISNGASPALVAKYLGHSNITTTLNIYTHMFKNELDDIIEMIDNIEN